MANQRHPDQRQIGFALHKGLLAQIDQRCRGKGLDRSGYIREAIIEKLQRLDPPITVPIEWRAKPVRTGKPYGKRKQPSSKTTDQAVSVLDAVAPPRKMKGKH